MLQAVDVLKQPTVDKSDMAVILTKTKIVALIVTIFGALKIALSAFGMNLGISDAQVNDVANAVATIATVAGPLVSYVLHRKIIKSV